MLDFLFGCFSIFSLYLIFSFLKNDCDDDSDTFNPRKSTDIDEINEWNKSHLDDTVEL